eukprot:CAMPEP_0194063306 /NCGR_PEP_ID=MMETSP0009_2-20130614/79985_1 /TAXON_ID=210454 /ORGANISM="Grammatophora oceanica, Strain CCMP 410" /LENGTH=53 /DNA_ID=CAMNT_0038715371 /DNA_START=46 /DNA_END=203 /DNA_ORIENTATION=+
MVKAGKSPSSNGSSATRPDDGKNSSTQESAPPNIPLVLPRPVDRPRRFDFCCS